MELSEAIKAGAKLRPQSFRMLLGDIGGTLGTCTMGAALDAVGILRIEHTACQLRFSYDPDFVRQHWPLLDKLVFSMPCGCNQLSVYVGPVCSGYAVSSVIAHLNDDHRWRRETIAQWVKSLERK